MAKERGDPLGDAVWLLEHVSRTKGAEHLKMASRNLNTLQLFCLDVLAAFMLVPLVIYKALMRRRNRHQGFLRKIKMD